MNLFFIIIFLISKFYSNSTSFNIKNSINSSITINNNSNFRKKNLIIGVLTKYSWPKIAPFIASYTKSGFKNCDLIIFVYNIPQSTITKMKSFRVIVYNVPEKYRYKKITNFRWKIYEDFLISNINKYNLVFSTDLRDVFFQKDFFNNYNSNISFLGVALEDGYLSERINKKWLIDAYGVDLYNSIKNQRIICAGTVWGTIDKLIEFSKIMWEKLESKWSLKNNVADQAVANYLIYHDKMFNDCLIKSENKNGLIMTIGLTKEKDIYFDINDNIVNGKGEVAAAIHQYDRKSKIVQKVINKYCYKIENNKVNYEKPKLNIFMKRNIVNYEKLKIFFFIFLIIILNIFILCFIFKNISKKKNINSLIQENIFKKKKSINIKNLDNGSFEIVRINYDLKEK
jgi:hypothetical protein